MKGGKFSSVEHHLHKGSWNPLTSPLALTQVFLSLPHPRAQPRVQQGEVLLGLMTWGEGDGKEWGGGVSCLEGEAESRAGRAQGCVGRGERMGGWRRKMGGVLTAFSYLIEPCSVFEIFRSYRAKERSLGLGGRGHRTWPHILIRPQLPREEATGTGPASSNLSTQRS